MRIFITGGAGFIGSNLAQRLHDDGAHITVYDNLILGRREHIAHLESSPRFKFIEADLLDLPRLKAEIADHDLVYHLAANSDISQGAKETDLDLKMGTVATYNVLEAMRLAEIKGIVFASTSAIYGEATVKPTPETYGPLHPISFYGASKLACEGLISAFAHNYGIQAWICRFGNVVGDNGTHGALYDFLKRLIATPDHLRILGNGKQAKPYLYVKDLVDAMIYIHGHGKDEVNYFNLACDGASTVDHIAQAAVAALGLEAVEFRYTGGERGWRGDVAQVRLSPDKLAQLGWKTQYSSDEAVSVAAQALAHQLKGAQS